MNNTEKQEFIKKKIVDALFECLKKKQIDDMTSDEIAKMANVSKRTLYKYFSSKKEMYLAIVKESFMDLSNRIQCELQEIEDVDPWLQIECIGREYIGYFLNNPIKAQLILHFDEIKYIKDFEKWVKNIQEYSNKFELTTFIQRYYDYHKIEPTTNIETLALYLWAEVQGMALLIMSKREWIKEFYKIDESKLIDEHLMLSKKILGETK